MIHSESMQLTSKSTQFLSPRQLSESLRRMCILQEGLVIYGNVPCLRNWGPPRLLSNPSESCKWMNKKYSVRTFMRIRREAYVWITLKHDYILPLEGITDGFGKLPALVCRWMENGTLSDYLKREFSALSEGRKLELVRQVADGLGYLHVKGVVHGDLTGTNVLIDDSGNVRLADFGLSLIAAEAGNVTFTSVQSGHTRWSAPEFLSFSDNSESPLKPTKRGGIYSFGCVMLQILSGVQPYAQYKAATQVIPAILHGRLPFHGVVINMDDEYKQLSSRCLSRDPEERPMIAEIIHIISHSIDNEFIIDAPAKLKLDVAERDADVIMDELNSVSGPSSFPCPQQPYDARRVSFTQAESGEGVTTIDEENTITTAIMNSPPKAPMIDPLRTLQKYQLSSTINSVCYYSDEEGHNWCAVVLEVGFLLSLLQGEHLISALFPIRVPGVMLDRFPHIDQEVKAEGYNVRDRFTFAPNIQAPGGIGVNIGGINRQVDKMVYRCLRLRSQRVQDEVHWEFVNETRHYFPTAVKLLLLVPGGSDSNSSPNFPFRLEICPTLKVRANLKTKRRHFFQSTTILQPGPSDHGWSCEIKDDYCPRIAKNVLAEREAVLRSGEHSRMVGLHAAVPVISY